MSPGDRLGRFVIHGELGHGGMGSVYLARAAGPGGFHRWVAIKRVHPHLAKDRVFVEMFLDEARLAAAVHHPHVAQVMELGEEDGAYFLVLEYLHGAHLGRLVHEAGRDPRSAIPVALAARVVADAARGLHAAHEATGQDGEALGIVHRDVSPSNVFVTFDGAVKVTDFGVARAEGRLAKTQSGRLKGKCAYMAPEQIYGDAFDRRADVFALGVILWELLTGQGLFHAESDAETLSRITSHDVPPPSERGPCPPDLEDIVLRALAADPEDRYPTAEALARDLEAFLADTPEPSHATALADWMREVHGPLRERRDALLRSSPDAPSPADAPPHATLAAPLRRLGPPLAGLVALGALGFGARLALQPATPSPVAARPDGGAARALSVVQIDSEPRGATVLLDGEERPGTTPLLLTDVPQGTHELELRRAGRSPKTLTLQVEAPTLQLSVSLAPAAPAAPTDADVEGPSPTPEGDPPSLATAPADPVPARSDAPRPRPRPARAPSRPSRSPPAPAAPTERAATEAPSPRTEAPIRGTARLSLRTTPWATVRLGERDLGVSPLLGVEIPAGTHVLEVRERGEGQIVRRTIRAAPGDHITQGIDFPPAP